MARTSPIPMKCFTEQLRERVAPNSAILQLRAVVWRSAKHSQPATDAMDSWRNIAITFIDPDRPNFSMSVNAFHEKAGGSQGDSFWYLLVTRFVLRRVATVATLPSALFDERFGALGASWVFSFQPVLPSVYRPRFHLQDESWARRLTQSPELGFGFSFRRAFLGFMQPPASLLACDCATVRKPLRSPTGDAARRPAFAQLQ